MSIRSHESLRKKYFYAKLEVRHILLKVNKSTKIYNVNLFVCIRN
jgi:hypothetical protein